LVVAEPIDYIARALNGKRQLPPLALRRYAGPLSNLEASGAEFLAYLKLLCGATSESRILDIGCGFGLVALQLRGYLGPSGRYVGLDINRAAVSWARRHITPKAPNFDFVHLDIWNGAYNSRGKEQAEAVVLPLADDSVDIVLLKSVFTHLRPKEVAHYLAEIARVMAPRGICLATFFLLNDVQDSLRKRGLNAVDFRFGDEQWRYAFREVPEVAVGYSERRVGEMAASAGLTTVGTRYGYWSGRADGLSYQDIVLLSPKA
jgi:SAM-dependent methyltransferase